MADPVPSTMSGFGSSDLTTPFYYGSVHDGIFRNDSLEQKLKKQYWKTKQTVIQKLGKNQDEFIIAGDTDIDTKLEKAYHLKLSCNELLQAIDKYIGRLRTVSIQESVMGEHLKVWSETEYSNAGEVMQNVGKLQENDSQNRLNVIPPLLRLRNEFSVFRNSAITDLNMSIELLEKARTDYRAALLWMKDVSGKLQNPDYRDQLARFREAQATVKETKRQFDRLKFDLGEKIEMVSASRCNLLSRSLPNYQKGVLGYSDTVANSFHKLLVDLRSHHHHQYKVRRVLEEIRDLEMDEVPFENEPGQEGDDFSSLTLPETARRPMFDDDDDPLLDIGMDEADNASDKDKPSGDKPSKNSGTTNLKKGGAFERQGDPFSFEEVAEQAKVKDLVLGGVEAELQALQNELLKPRETKNPPKSRSPDSNAVGKGLKPEDGKTNTQAETEMDDLFGLDIDGAGELPLEPSSLKPPSGQDQLVSEWDSFSAFMPGTQSSSSGWERDFLGNTPSSSSTVSPPKILSPTPATNVVRSSHQSPQPDPKNVSEDPSSKDATPAEGSTPVPPVVEDSPPKPLATADATTKPPSDIVIDGGSASATDDVDSLLGLVGAKDAGHKPEDRGSTSDELLSRELESMGIPSTLSSSSSEKYKAFGSVPPPSLTASSGLDSINSNLFQMHSTQPYVPPAAQVTGAPEGSREQMSPFRSPLAPGQGPPVFPTQGVMGNVMAPPKFGLVPGGPVAAMTGAGVMDGKRGVAKEEEKGTKWMNFFAHLDPLVNEKV